MASYTLYSNGIVSATGMSSEAASMSFLAAPALITSMDDYYTTISVSGNSTTNVDVDGIRNDNEGEILSLGGGDEMSYTPPDPGGHFGSVMPTMTLNAIMASAWAGSSLDQSVQIELGSTPTVSSVNQAHGQIDYVLKWSMANIVASPATTVKQANLQTGFQELYKDAKSCGVVAVNVASVAYAFSKGPVAGILAAANLLAAGSSNLVGCVQAVNQFHNGTLDTNERAAIQDLINSFVKLNDEIDTNYQMAGAGKMHQVTASKPVKFVFTNFNHPTYSATHALELTQNSPLLAAFMKTSPVHLI